VIGGWVELGPCIKRIYVEGEKVLGEGCGILGLLSA